MEWFKQNRNTQAMSSWPFSCQPSTVEFSLPTRPLLREENTSLSCTSSTKAQSRSVCRTRIRTSSSLSTNRTTSVTTRFWWISKHLSATSQALIVPHTHTVSRRKTSKTSWWPSQMPRTYSWIGPSRDALSLGGSRSSMRDLQTSISRQTSMEQSSH